MTNATTPQLNKPLAGKKLEEFLAGLRLLYGSHQPDGQMCIMEATAYVAGEPWSDHPACVSPVIADFLRAWNDGMNEDDRQMLKPYVTRVIGTKAPAVVERQRAWMILDWRCRVSVPEWLRAAHLDDAADTLEAQAPIVDAKSAVQAQSALDAAKAKAYAAYSAAYSAARSVARSAARSAADSAAYSAADSAARSAARSAADSAAYSVAYSAADSVAYSAAYSVARSAAYSAADSAAYSVARSAAYSAADSAAYSVAYSAAYSVARSAAYSAADSALRPTVETLQRSALGLLDRLIAVQES